MMCSIIGDAGSSLRTAWTVTRAASSSGKPPTPVPARPLDLPTHARRHPQRQVGGVHDRVDFEFADVAVPEFDPSQRVSCGGSTREPGGPAGASYTRVNRPDIAVTTSQEFVLRHRATSAAVISASP